MSAPRIFISYSRADHEWAEWIASVIESAGYAPFLQAWDIRPGMNFGAEMQQAAMESSFTLAVLSPAFLKSEFTQPEWLAAFVSDPTGRDRELIPVRVAGCELPGLLKAAVYIDLVNLDESAARKALVDGPKPSGSSTGEVSLPGRPAATSVGSAPFPLSLARRHYVPNLPPHSLSRTDKLNALRDRVLGDDSSRLAITGYGQAVGSDDGTLKVWDLENKREPRAPMGHRGWITAVA